MLDAETAVVSGDLGASESPISFDSPPKTRNAAKNPVKAQPAYACKVCHKRFKRNEHCIRHERTHSHEKPYSCRYCRRRYARTDLVVRHERTIHAEQQARDIAEGRLPPNPGVQHESPPATPPDLESDVSAIPSDKRPSTTTSTAPGAPSSMLTPEEPSHVPGPGSALNGLSTTNNNGLMATDGLSLSGMSPFQAALSEATGFDNPPSNRIDSGSSCLAPINDFDHTMMFDFGDVAAHALLQPDGGLPPLLHLDHTFSDSGNSSGYQDNAFVDTPQGPSGILQPNLPGNSEDPFNFEPSKLRQAIAKPSKFVFTDEMRLDLLKDLRNRSLGSLINENTLPSAKIIQVSLRSYVDCFDPHLPVIHIPTFVMDGAPSPLILAMCAIGSLYRLERKNAGDFYSIADEVMSCCSETMGPKPRLRRMSSIFDSTARMLASSATQEPPIWTVQCKLLLNVFALFGWDGALAEHALEDFLEMSKEFRRRTSPVQRVQSPDRGSTWHSWVEAESTKRTLCGILITDSLSAVTYGSVPGHYYEEADMDMPEDDRLWRCPTEKQWQQQVDNQIANPPLNLEQLLAHIMAEDKSVDRTKVNWSWSLFAVIVSMHALNVHIWHVALAAEALRILPLHRQDSMRATFWADMDKALNSCQRAFTSGKGDSDPWQDPLLFNCLAVLRTAYMRGCTDSQKPFNRRVLLSCDPVIVEREIEAYVLSNQSRGPRITEAVSRAFSAMLLPMRAGAMLVRKTAALTWSIEHAIAWWDTALFFTRWTYSTECLLRQHEPIHQEEEQTLQNIRSFLSSESDTDYYANPPLASGVARLWASFLDDTWVWGVTPRMGWVLREFAKFYDRHFNESVMPSIQNAARPATM